jgi:hypothetical protein
MRTIAIILALALIVLFVSGCSVQAFRGGMHSGRDDRCITGDQLVQAIDYVKNNSQCPDVMSPQQCEIWYSGVVSGLDGLSARLS